LVEILGFKNHNYVIKTIETCNFIWPPICKYLPKLVSMSWSRFFSYLYHSWGKKIAFIAQK
jgi:hypothetical protein